MSDDLNIQQRKFVIAYLKTGNGKQSAIAAGYSKKTADVQASRLLANAKVKQALVKPISKAVEKTELTAERVIAELEKVAFTDVKIEGAQKMAALSRLLDYLKPSDDNKKDVFNLTINLSEPAARVQDDDAKTIDQPTTNLPRINL